MIARCDQRSPFLRARALHGAEGGPRTFEEDILAHFSNGYVVAAPDAFVLFRPVVATASPEWIVDPSYRFPVAHCDCWHCYLAAGCLRAIVSYVPYLLPFLSFERRGKLKIYDLQRFQQRESNSKISCDVRKNRERS